MVRLSALPFNLTGVNLIPDVLKMSSESWIIPVCNFRAPLFLRNSQILRGREHLRVLQ